MEEKRLKNIDWGSFVGSSVQLDGDTTVVLQSLLVGAIQATDVETELSRLHQIIISNNIASEIDVLAAVPLLLPLPCLSAATLLDTISSECSAKELIITIQESSEAIRRNIQAGEDDNEQTDGESEIKELSIAAQSTRLLKICSLAIPRLRKGKIPPQDTLEPVLSEFEGLLSANAEAISQADAQHLLNGMVEVLGSVIVWAQEDVSNGLDDLLFHFVEGVLGAYASYTSAHIAQDTFKLSFPRFVMPGPPQLAGRLDAAADAWRMLTKAGISLDRITGKPSIGNLILLAHSESAVSISNLEAFLPVIISCIQVNSAIEEVLTLLMRSFPRRTTAPSPITLPPDLATLLMHLLSQLASAHPDPGMRHITFRVLGHVLWLTPPPLRMQLLKELLTDPDTPEQMLVAGIGLVKEAVVEAFSPRAPTPNVFASPAFIDTLGRVLFRPHLPEDTDVEQSLDEFLQSAEPRRLVDVVALLFVVLERDSENRTGIRTGESLRSLRKELLEPVRDRLQIWNTVDLEESEDARMQLGILDMWVERVLNEVLVAEGGV